MKNQKSTYSWTAVVFMLILFWPVGIFMLIGKLANDRSANFGGGAGIVKLMGMALVGLGVLVFIVAVTDPELMSGGIISLVVFGLPGLWLLKRSKRMKSTGIRNRGYINYIVNTPRKLSAPSNRGKESINSVTDLPDLIGGAK